MRKFLMASAATLGAVGMVGAASAQTPPGSPVEGQVLTNPGWFSGANNNNNYQASAIPGAIAVPTPGTFVIHLNGRVFMEATLSSSSLNTYTQPVAAAAPGAVTAVPGTAASFAPTGGTYKQNAQAFQGYFRLYPGVDAMATNGLRYGASVEIRENWDTTTPGGGNVNNGSSSGQTSAQSIFVRRAFVYAAGAQWGIVRFGQGDGVLGIFDNGVTSMQGVSPSGGMNGSDVQAPVPQNTIMPFPFYAQNGIEYGNMKIVYLSPQFAGFDIGVEYAPSNSNAEQNGNCTNGTTSSPSALGVTGVNATNCTTLASSPTASDAIRYTNQVEAGARYQGTLGPVALLVHGSYLGSGIVDYTGALPTNHAGSHWNGKYNPLSVFQGGVAMTIAGLTIGGLVNSGAMNNNGQGTPQPVGGVSQTAFVIGGQYSIGDFTAGIAYEQADSQGSANLVGVSQRHEWGINPGIDYKIAPGLQVFAEYWYGQRHQSQFNFATGSATAGTGAYNDVRSQVFLVGSAVYW